MHIYIYDDFINTNKYDNILANIETRITDLGLNGKIVRLGVMKSARDTIENELKRGAKTIIAVGNDQTVSKIINALAGIQASGYLEISTPVGIIPIEEKNNLIAKATGITEASEACDVLSARRIEAMDIARANQNFFLAQAVIPSQKTTLEINKDFSIEISEAGEIRIINLLTFSNTLADMKPNPQDGLLELYIETQPGRKILQRKQPISQSFFSLKKLIINNPNFPIIIDNTIKIPCPVEISLSYKKINFIVGKERGF